MPNVYLETTIPSYLAAYSSRDLIIAAHQQITHSSTLTTRNWAWWDERGLTCRISLSPSPTRSIIW